MAPGAGHCWHWGFFGFFGLFLLFPTLPVLLRSHRWVTTYCWVFQGRVTMRLPWILLLPNAQNWVKIQGERNTAPNETAPSDHDLQIRSHPARIAGTQKMGGGRRGEKKKTRQDPKMVFSVRGSPHPKAAIHPEAARGGVIGGRKSAMGGR